jgi:hypothetical protein
MDICKEIYTFFGNYLFLPVNILGFCLNILCIVAFCHSKQLRLNNSNLFKYLLIKAVCDVVILSRNTVLKLFGKYLRIFYNIESCIIIVIYEYYIGRIALLLSVLCEVATNFDRFRTIANRFLFMNKISFTIKITLLILYCLVFYAYVFFQDQCYEIKTNSSALISNLTSVVKYKTLTPSYFRESNLGKFLKFFHSFFRDFILMIIIIILNLATLIFVRNSFRKKRTMNLKPKNKTTRQNNKNIKLEKAEKNLTLMVFSSSLVNFIGHFFQFLWFLPINELKNSDCLNEIGTILLYLSYSITFFVYYSFNKHFKFYFNHYIIKFLKLITFNRLKFLTNTKYECSMTSQI